MNMTNYHLNLQSVADNILSEQKVTPEAKKVAINQVGTVNVLSPNASLSFNGDTLTWMTNGTPIKNWKAESGLTVKNSKPSEWGKMIRRYTANPTEWSKDKNAGPTPPGNYVLGDLQTRKGAHSPEISQIRSMWLAITHGSKGKWTDSSQAFHLDTIYSRIGWGNFRAPVIATKGTETFGRGSFYLHGGSVPGTHGCIDLTDQMDDFAKFYGTWLASTNRKSIPLVVNYGEEKNGFFRELWKSVTTRKPKTDPEPNDTVTPEKETWRDRLNARRAKIQTSQPAEPKQPAQVKILKVGSSGPEVKKMQDRLQQLNYNIGTSGADGKFGQNTLKALIQFQNANQLQADGVFGPKTHYKMFSNFKTSPVPPMKNEFM